MNKNRILILFLILLPLVHFSMLLYLPSLPAMQLELHASSKMMRWTLTTFMLGLGISQLVYGPYSDHFGRRPVLFFGLILFLLTTLFCIIATNEPILLVARLLQGIAIGAAPLVAHAVFGEIFKGRELAKATSYNTIVHSVPPLLAPALGGYIQHYLGWRENFMFLFIYGLMITLLLFKFLPETRAKHLREKRSLIRHLLAYLQLMRHPPFVIYSVCLMCSYGIIITYNLVAPFLLQHIHHLSAARYGELTLLAGIAYLVGAGLNRMGLRWFTPLRLTAFGSMGVVITGILMFYLAQRDLGNVYFIILPAYATFMCVGLIMPNVLSGAIQQFPTITGTASALSNALMLLGGALISYFIGHLPVHHQYGIIVAFLTLGLFILMGALGLSLICEEKHA